MSIAQIIIFFIAGLKRLLIELFGFALIGVALLMAVSFLFYNHSDPSINVAIAGDSSNITGTYGAITADLLMQTLGLASWIAPAFFAVLGVQLLLLHVVKNLIQRVTLLLLAAPLLAIGFEGLIVHSGLWHSGGALGILFLQGIKTTLPILPLRFYQGISSMCLIFGGILACMSFRFHLSTLISLIKPTWHTMNKASSFIADKINQGATKSLDTARAITPHASTLWQRVIKHKAPLNAFLEAVPIPPSHSHTEPFFAAKDDTDTSQMSAATQPKTTASPKVTPMPSVVAALRGVEAAQLPPLELLSDTPQDALAQTIPQHFIDEQVALLAKVLDDFGVRGEITDVKPGPVVTLYELKPAPGVKSSRVIGLADDIARSMSALSARVAVVPGRNVIGIELPNVVRQTVYLRDLLESKEYKTSSAHLALALGKDISGQPSIADLARMPHLLVAGTTGSGKSVGVNGMILSLLYRMTPQQCKFIMIDPKMLELSIYDGIPHLLAPVVTDPKRAVVALKWTVREMESRYRAMSQLGVRNIEGYNTRLREARKKGEVILRKVQVGFDSETGKPLFESQPLNLDTLPFIVVIVDEMADLMLVAGKEIEATIQRLAQMARAAGIHLIMATQRPSVDVITGTIKANFPTRISFQVTSKIDSRTILSEQGAEQLLGQGDMLYMAAGGRISRVHGPFVMDQDVEAVVQHLKAQGAPDYIDSITEDLEEAPAEARDTGKSSDALYDQALELVCRDGKASTSYVQRHLQIGYNRAARIIERMETEGVVSEANHVGKREVLKRTA